MLKEVFRFAGFVTVGALYLSFAGTSEAATYYVAKTGSNSSTCAAAQNISTPKATIGGGISCMSSGDTLFVRGGVYNETLYSGSPSGVPPSGTAGAYTRFAAYNGETVVLRPTVSAAGQVVDFFNSEHHIEFDGISFDATFVTGGIKIEEYLGMTQSHHIRIKNFDLYGYSGLAILLTGNQPTLIGGNEILHGTIRNSQHTISGPLPGEGMYIESSNN